MDHSFGAGAGEGGLMHKLKALLCIILGHTANTYSCAIGGCRHCFRCRKYLTYIGYIEEQNRPINTEEIKRR